MPILSTDLQYRLSVKTGAAGDTTASTPAASLGGYPSTTQPTTAQLHNLFDTVTGDENTAGDVEYRGLFIYNANASLTWDTVVVWIQSETAGGASIAIGVDTTAALDVDSASKHLEIADESTAPSGVSFSSPTTKGAGLALGNIAADFCRQVWIRRTAANTTALDNDGVVLRCEGNTS